LGAGGATRGVIGPLLARGPALIAIANRTPARAADIARDFKGPLVASGFDALERAPFDLVLNATSAGLAGEVPPVAPEVVGPMTVCYDMGYAPGETPFTRWAAQRGAAATHRGWG